MADRIDLKRYEGHAVDWRHARLPDDERTGTATFEANGPGVKLLLDAPMLLAEVERLRRDLATRYWEGIRKENADLKGRAEKAEAEKVKAWDMLLGVDKALQAAGYKSGGRVAAIERMGAELAARKSTTVGWRKAHLLEAELAEARELLRALDNHEVDPRHPDWFKRFSVLQNKASAYLAKTEHQGGG